MASQTESNFEMELYEDIDGGMHDWQCWGLDNWMLSKDYYINNAALYQQTIHSMARMYMAFDSHEDLDSNENECDCCDRNKPCGEIFCDCCGESWRNDKPGSETCHCCCSRCENLLRDCRYSCEDKDEESDDEDEAPTDEDVADEEEDEDDEDEDDEEEDDEDELWNANLMKGDNNSRLMKEAMKLYPNNREACISHISVKSCGTFNGLVSN